MGVHVLYTSFKNIFHTTFCNQKKCSPYNYEKWWSIILPISTKCPTRSHLKPLNTIMTLTYTCHENNACCAQLNNLSSP